MQNSLVLEKSAVPVRRSRMVSAVISVSRKKDNSRIQALGEAIILQSIEDLFNSLQRKKSIEFFKSESFSLCAEIAGLSTVDQIRLIRMLVNADFKESL